MKYFHSFLAFFATFIFIHFAFGQSPGDLKKTSPFHYQYLDDFYVRAGSEVPWPMIAKPSWDSFLRETVGKKGEEFVEGKIDYRTVGEWRELNPKKKDNPKFVDVEIFEKDERLFQVFMTNPNGNGIMSGQGYFDDWSRSLGIYDQKDLVKQRNLDQKANFIVLDPEKTDGQPGRLRLVQIQGHISKKTFLGISLVQGDRQLDYLFRPVVKDDPEK